MNTTRKTLLQKIQDGDECSWTEFDEQYRPFICAVANLCRLPPDACEDVAQNVMLSIFQNGKLGWNPAQGRFRDYLAGIVRHHVTDYYRKNGRVLNLSEEIEDTADIPDPATDPFDRIFTEEYRTHLKELTLKELRSRVAALTYESFQLTELRGLSGKEAAELLQIPQAAVYVHRSRCLKKLREIGRELQRMDPDMVP